MTEEIKKMINNLNITPDRLRQLLTRKDEIISGAKAVRLDYDSRIFLVANGSSKVGLQIAAFHWEKLLGIKPYVFGPYEFNHYPTTLRSTDIVLALSQTGTSHEVVEAIRLAGKQGAMTIAITTIADSIISQEAKLSFIIPEGIENNHYKILGVISGIVATYLVGYGIAIANGFDTEIDNDIKELNIIIDRYGDNAKATRSWVEANYEYQLKTATSFTVIGSGPLQAIAEELAIKIMEVTNKQSLFMELEEYMHGACAVTDPDNYLIMIVGEEYADFALRYHDALAEDSKAMIWIGAKAPEAQVPIVLSKDPLMAVFDALAAVHGFIITYGELGEHGAEGSRLFEYFQEALKIRE